MIHITFLYSIQSIMQILFFRPKKYPPGFLVIYDQIPFLGGMNHPAEERNHLNFQQFLSTYLLYLISMEYLIFHNCDKYMSSNKNQSILLPTYCLLSYKAFSLIEIHAKYFLLTTTAQSFMHSN